MLVVISDTHTDALDLPDRVASAVEAADTVVHAGDVTGQETFEALAAKTDRLVAVHGNRDVPALCDQLPETRVFEYADRRIAVAHGHHHDEQSLGLFGRAEEAAVVVFGHSHRPTLLDTDDVVLLNPGSPTQPSGHRSAYAMVRSNGSDLTVQLLAIDGTLLEKTRI